MTRFISPETMSGLWSAQVDLEKLNERLEPSDAKRQVEWQIEALKDAQVQLKRLDAMPELLRRTALDVIAGRQSEES